MKVKPSNSYDNREGSSFEKDLVAGVLKLHSMYYIFACIVVVLKDEDDLVFVEMGEDDVDMIDMEEKGGYVNKDVVKEDNDVIVEKVMENIIYKELESGECVGKTEYHHFSIVVDMKDYGSENRAH